jgi:hypothetical protein
MNIAKGLSEHNANASIKEPQPATGLASEIPQEEKSEATVEEEVVDNPYS